MGVSISKIGPVGPEMAVPFLPKYLSIPSWSICGQVYGDNTRSGSDGGSGVLDTAGVDTGWMDEPRWRRSRVRGSSRALRASCEVRPVSG
jgi:hypothetical protein